MLQAKLRHGDMQQAGSARESPDVHLCHLFSPRARHTVGSSLGPGTIIRPKMQRFGARHYHTRFIPASV